MNTTRFLISTAIISTVLLFSINLTYGYHPISPYAYTLNNPIRYVDPNGMDVWEFDQFGNIKKRTEDHSRDAFYMVEPTDNGWQRTGQELVFDYGTVTQETRSLTVGDVSGSYDVYTVKGDNNGTALFNFMANNITGSPTQVEIGQVMTGTAGDRGVNFVTTSHEPQKESGMRDLYATQLYNGYTVREMNHSHPNNAYPSGLEIGNKDIGFSRMVTNNQNRNNLLIPAFHIYHVPTQQKIQFWPYSQRFHFK